MFRLRDRVLPDAVERADLALFRRAARRHAPALDRVLLPLTRAANRSGLWLAIATVLGFAGGRFGRRAGLRGVFAIASTSAVTNLGAKLLWRRRRPALDDVPVIRRLARLPTSSSFPSGHAAAAFAFATGATLEKPALAAPLYAAAAAVAYSRVHAGVHYPSDVVAGAAVGAGVAIATRHLWPVAPEEPALARPAAVPLEERPDPDGRGLSIVVNPSAGNGFTGSPSDALREALPGAEIIEVDEALTLPEALEKAVAGGRAVGICGGDGSVNAAARAAHEAGKPLVVFPGGTLNHFARDAGIASLDDAIAAVRDGEAVAVDVGQIAGRPFLNTASIGAYVDLVDARERLEERIGKWPAVLVALVRVLRKGEPTQIQIDGGLRRVWMIFIGNCRYHPPGFAPSWRDRLDDGLLDLRTVDAAQPFARLRLIWAVVTGTLPRCGIYRCRVTDEPTRVRSLDGPTRLARDGETFDAPEEFTISKAAEPLVVLLPPATRTERDEDPAHSRRR
jgi:undecaprenyl-diphosphatase